MLVDSNIIIDLSRGSRVAADFINQQLRQNRLFISAITAMEVIVGARHKKDLASLTELLKLFNPIKLNEEITDAGLGLLKTYSLSHSLSIPDALIAATALVFDLPLATANLKHFKVIKHLKVSEPY